MNIATKRLMRDTIRKEICDKHGSCTHCPLDLASEQAECVLTQLNDEILEEYKNTPVELGQTVEIDEKRYMLICDHAKMTDWVNLVSLDSGIGLGEFQCNDVTIGALEAYYETDIKLTDNSPT